MLKVCEIATGYAAIPAKVGAATEIVVENLTNSLLQKGIDVVVFDLENKERPPSRCKFIDVKIPFFLTKVAYSLGVLHKIKRIIYSVSLSLTFRRLNKDPDTVYVVHFHNQYNFFFFSLFLSKRDRIKIKTLYTVHSYIWSQPWEKIKKIVFRRYFLEIYSLKRADCVVTLNKTAFTTITTEIRKDRTSVFLHPNGVNTHVYHPDRKNPDAISLLTNLGISQRSRVVLHVGSICERKNQLGIVKALNPILQKNNTVFLFAGGIISNEYLSSIQDFARSNNIEQKIKYVGEIEPGYKLNCLYNTADAFVFLSTMEAFSLVILEAMSAGLALFVGEEYESLFEGSANDHGITFVNVNNIASQIERLWENNTVNQQKRSEAASFARRHFSWEQIAEKYIAMFSKLTKTNGGR